MNSFTWAVLTALTWGCVPVLEKIGLEKVQSVWVGVFYRCCGVFVGFLFFWIFKGKEIKASLAQPPQGIAYLIAAGVLASVVGQLFFYNALKTGEASRVVPIAGAFPLVTFFLGLLFLKEILTFQKLGGVLLVLLGVFLLR